MRVLIVYAHPNPSSFNHAILEHCSLGLQEAGHDVRVKDLYAENFDPVLRADELAALQSGQIPDKIRHEQEALLWAEGLIFIYPLWWYSCPAILKGWFDHVLTNGVAYAYTNKGLQGLLKHQRAVVLMTAGSSETFFQKNDAVQLIQRPITEGTLAFCGIEDVYHRTFYGVPGSSEETRAQILNEVAELGRQFAC